MASLTTIPQSEGETKFTIELYENIGCPFARRSMLAVFEKALDAQHFVIPLSGQLKKIQKDGLGAAPGLSASLSGKSVEEMLAIKEQYKIDINPTGEVPSLAIRHSDTKLDVVTEADVVCEFLEDQFPDSGNSLMPPDALGRSKIRTWIKTLNGANGVRAMYGTLMNQDPSKDEAMRAAVYKGMATFARLANDDGPYFLGAQVRIHCLRVWLLIPCLFFVLFLLTRYQQAYLLFCFVSILTCNTLFIVFFGGFAAVANVGSV